MPECNPSLTSIKPLKIDNNYCGNAGAKTALYEGHEVRMLVAVCKINMIWNKLDLS